MASTWPEQDACAKWWDAHWRELKEAVTRERLVQQDRAEKAEQRIQQLEEENDRLKTLNKALKVQKDPEQHLIPWDKAKQDLYIQQLEEALRFYADEEKYRYTLWGQDGFGRDYETEKVALDGGAKARAVVFPSKPEEGEDG